jgi:2-dehydropantoate 2-reductase
VDGRESRPAVSIVDAVPNTPLDLVVIAVRREQAVLAAVQAARSTAVAALFFGNFAGMVADLGASIGSHRALAGFPGVGGRIEPDGSVTYVVIGQQPTVVGTIGAVDEAAQSTATTLGEAGFPTRLEPDIERWLGSHAALVAPMAAAVKAAGGRADVLADRKDLLRMATQATKMIYRRQRARGELVVSANLRLLYLVMPAWFAVRYWSRALRGDFGELAFAAHTRHAWGEMAALSAWLRSSLTDDPAAIAALDRLLDIATDVNQSGDR